MNYIFCVVILVTSQGAGIIGVNANFDGWHQFNNHHYYDDPYLERPCVVHDLNCIRSFFAKKTGCSPVHGTLRDPILKELEFDIPFVNVTLELNNALLRGLSKGHVRTFFINKRTDSLVFEVEFDNLQIESLETVVSQYFKGREPVVATDATSAEFRDLSLTLTIRNIYDVKHIKSHVHAHVSDPYPDVYLGPGITHKKKARYLDNTRKEYGQESQIHNLNLPNQKNDKEIVKRPCSINDIDCIRSFFAYNYKCYPMHGLAPDPYILSSVPIELPHANMTMTLYDAKVQGLNSGRIQEFYINKNTDTLVLEVEFEKVVVNTPNTLMTYHRKGQEPIKASDLTLIEFRNMSLTLTTAVSKMTPYNTFVYLYLPNPKPLLQVGSGLLRSKERDQSALDITWMNNIELSVKEAFVIVGPIYMAAFLNSKICDFSNE
ncbi:unnamed protein product [Arctia plantaginis]|uniref:Uncharacterized protein n=1 Tax=Arctia plantaginis TaxID=874455 RepID=A0A8S0Z4A2_ARCPL|nr:unnamed protein product [Arctia plantaginis]